MDSILSLIFFSGDTNQCDAIKDPNQNEAMVEKKLKITWLFIVICSYCDELLLLAPGV